MKKNISNYDIFISYNETDRSWAKSLTKALSKEGYNVFFDREKIKADDDIWEKTFSALSSSGYIIFVLSKNGLNSNWEQMEVIAEIWLELLNRKKKSLIITLSELKVPTLIKQSKFIDSQDDSDVDDILEEIIERIKPVKVRSAKKNPVSKSIESEILKSLRLKLKFSFYFANPLRENIDKVYDQFSFNDHLQIIESKNINQGNYYLSYWGYKTAKLICPELFDNFAKKNATLIYSQFGKKILFELPLLKPSSEYKFVKSVKHTIWAIEMLLLLESHLDFVGEIAENLLENSSSYMNNDGGWKDYLSPERQSSLITSLYAFSLFSRIDQKKELIDVPKRQKGILKQIIQQTEKYILNKWDERKWEFSNLNWQISSINTFIHYAPFSTNKEFLKKITSTFYDFISENGTLIKPLIGTEFYLSENILSIRLLYALNLVSGINMKKTKFNHLKEKVVENYSHSEFMNNYDIFFMAEMLTIENEG